MKISVIIGPSTSKICNIYAHIFFKFEFYINLLLCFRGPAHNDCNLAFRLKVDEMKVSCFIHNLRGYDAHFIMNAVKSHHGEMTVIANNEEKYVSFTIGMYFLHILMYNVECFM